MWPANCVMWLGLYLGRFPTGSRIKCGKTAVEVLGSTPALAVMPDKRSEDPVPRAKQQGGAHNTYLMSALAEEAFVSML
ncbi:hypothetical protein [Pseudovibrio sp. Ad5]|uniref:hypothetical protein n=1 Tax=Pseudovibrio sp. Ad5 TaxID=989436 RepID=UPI00129047AB|nr:hypothetical protein [Pseudovibrio sp. Ad5]